jgi:electron transfer flavoprotein beta subunit
MADSVVLLKPTPDVRMLGELRLKDGKPDFPAVKPSFLDLYALEAAVTQKENALKAGVQSGQVVTVSLMDGTLVEKIARDGLARGADRAVVVSDPALAGQYAVGDSGLVARVLVAAIRKKVPEYEFIFCGSQSEDGYAGSVGPMVAEYLGIPQLTFVDKLDIGTDAITAERSREGGLERVVTPRGRMLFSVTNSLKDPRFASMQGIMRSRSKPIERLTLADLGVTAAPSVDISYAKPPERSDACQYVGSGVTYEGVAARILKGAGA